MKRNTSNSYNTHMGYDQYEKYFGKFMWTQPTLFEWPWWWGMYQQNWWVQKHTSTKSTKLGDNGIIYLYNPKVTTPNKRAYWGLIEGEHWVLSNLNIWISVLGLIPWRKNKVIIYGDSLSHRGTPSYHPFRTMDFPWNKPSVCGCLHLWKPPYGVVFLNDLSTINAFLHGYSTLHVFFVFSGNCLKNIKSIIKLL